MLEVLLNKQTVLMRFLEPLNVTNALSYFFLNLIPIQLHHSFRRLQKSSVIIQLIQQKSQLSNDVVDSIHLHYQLRLF